MNCSIDTVYSSAGILPSWESLETSIVDVDESTSAGILMLASDNINANWTPHADSFFVQMLKIIAPINIPFLSRILFLFGNVLDRKGWERLRYSP